MEASDWVQLSAEDRHSDRQGIDSRFDRDYSSFVF